MFDPLSPSSCPHSYWMPPRCLPAALAQWCVLSVFLFSPNFCSKSMCFEIMTNFKHKRKLVIFVSRILLPPALLTKLWPKCWKITKIECSKFSDQNLRKVLDDSLILEEFQSHLVYYFGILHELWQEFFACNFILNMFLIKLSRKRYRLNRKWRTRWTKNTAD